MKNTVTLTKPIPPDALPSAITLLRQGQLKEALLSLVEDAALLAGKTIPIYSDGLLLGATSRREKLAQACEEAALRLTQVAHKLRQDA